MKKKLLSTIGLLSILQFSNANALTVDKMVMFAEKDKEVANLVVTNPANYPVMFRVSIGEFVDGKVQQLDVNDFKNWHAYLDREEYFIEPKSEISLDVRLLSNMLKKKIEDDVILAIDVTPESVPQSDNKSNESMNILIGYRTWLIIPHNQEVEGRPEIKVEDGEYYIENKSDSVAFFDVNACKTEFEEGVKCSGTEWALAGKKKKLHFEKYKDGEVVIKMRDAFGRYSKTSTVQL